MDDYNVIYLMAVSLYPLLSQDFCKGSGIAFDKSESIRAHFARKG